MKSACSILFLLIFAGIFGQEKAEVFFDFNKDVPNESSADMLGRLVQDHPDAVVTEIAGYCDQVDANDYNRQLASRRIGTVLKILRDRGMTIADDVALRPVGEDFSLDSEAALNRRVDVFYRNATAGPKPDPGDTRPREYVYEPDPSDVPFEKALLKAKPGDVIRIQDINFYLNSEIVVPESEPRLQALYDEMVDNPKLSIEIHGHICCNPNINDTKLSYRRAKYIFTYLLKKGIPLNRLAYKGFGSARPIYRIPERTMQEKAANRRVEILIVKI